MQDNTEELLINAKLTKVGRQRLFENRFNITKFAGSDDGINYDLIDENLIDRFIPIERSLAFHIWRNSEDVQKNLLSVDKSARLSKWNYDLTVQQQRTFQTSNDANNRDDIVRPVLQNFESNKQIAYRFKGTFGIKDEIDSVLSISIDSLPSPQSGRLYSITLHDPFHFDIAMDQSNIDLFASTLTTEKFENVKNSLLFDASRRVRDIDDLIKFPSGDGFEEEAPVIDKHVLECNLEESLDLGVLPPTHIPKTINVVTPSTGNSIPFRIRYRGNFLANGSTFQPYDTFMTIRDTHTGNYEVIRLRIMPFDNRNNLDTARA